MKQRREYQNVSMEVKKFDKNKTLYQKYDGESLKNILCKIPFSEVNIPLYSDKTFFFGDKAYGTQLVGYIEGYDEEKNTFKVIIHEKFGNTIQEFKNPIIFVRPQIIGDKVVKILGFDIVPSMYYFNIR